MKTNAGGLGPRPRPLVVQRGLVLPPAVLRAVLPDVATAVNNVTSANSKQPVTPTASESRPRDTVTAFREQRNVKNILNPFPCKICEKQFPTRNTLNMHWLEHDYQCKRCKAMFDFKDLLLKHKCCPYCKGICQCMEYKKDKKRCHKSKCSVENYELTYKNLQTYKKRIQCPICELKFEKRKDLIIHKILTKFPCRRCKKCYQTSSEHVLPCQVTTVTSRKPAVEPERRRRRIPTPRLIQKVCRPQGCSHSLPYICRHCGESFEESLSFTSHIRTHIPAKSYPRARKNAKLTSQNTIMKASQDEVDDKKGGCEDMTDGNLSNINKGLDNSVEVKTDENNSNDPVRAVIDIDEEQCDDIKGERAEFELVSPEARTTLYVGHQIQGEMVLGPVRILPPDIKRSVEDVTDGKCLGNIKKPDKREERLDENDSKAPERQLVDIKEECDDMEIKTELDDIKLEPAEFEFVSPEAQTTLYVGHHLRGQSLKINRVTSASNPSKH